LEIQSPCTRSCFGTGCAAAWVYQFSSSTNELNAYGQPLHGFDSGFGCLVSLSPDAGTLAVAELADQATPYSVYLFEMLQGVWQLSFNLTQKVNPFGFGEGAYTSTYEAYLSMDLSGSSPYTLAVGSSGRDLNGPSYVSLYHN
jgi:hypothetical protein